MSKKIIATDHLHVAKNLVEMYKGKEDYNSEKISGVLDYNLEKGIIDNDQFCKAKDQLDTIEKGRGKTKKIGELDKSGRNIKTANGWVPVKHAARAHAAPADEASISKKLQAILKVKSNLSIGGDRFSFNGRTGKYHDVQTGENISEASVIKRYDKLMAEKTALDISTYGLDKYHKIIDSAVKSRKGFYTGSGYDTDVQLFEEKKGHYGAPKAVYAILHLFHPRNNFKYANGQQSTLATAVCMKTENGKTWKKVEEQVINHGYGGQVLKNTMGRLDSAYNGNDYIKMSLSPQHLKNREIRAERKAEADAKLAEEKAIVDKQLSEAKFDEKDLNRIKDLMGRSFRVENSDEKLIQLATSQANSIKDPEKAMRRAAAANSMDKNEVANIFYNKAKELGYEYEAPYEPKKRKEESGETKHAQREFSILPLGRINLKTGSSKYFNVYETWGEDTTYEVYKDGNSGYGDVKPRYKIVATSGKNPLKDIGDHSAFKHDQTFRPMFEGELVDYATGTELKKLAPIYGNSIAGYTYK